MGQTITYLCPTKINLKNALIIVIKFSSCNPLLYLNLYIFSNIQMDPLRIQVFSINCEKTVKRGK